jgi:single-strand DNA-binding protein
MYNRVILVGRLTRDPELRYLPSGTAVATFGIATSRSWTDKNTNEKKEEVMFIDVTSFARSAEIVNQYLKKGNKVLVEGRLVLDRWTDQNGQNRSKHTVRADSVQFMETRAEAQNSQNSYNAPSQGEYTPKNEYNQPNKPTPSSSQESNIPEIDIDDEEIPF